MSADEFVPRSEFEREKEITREYFARIGVRQDKSDARHDRSEAQHLEHATELKQLKTLIVEGFRDLRSDVQSLRSFSRRFAEGLAVGAGISYALYQAIHAALGGHL
ncbi:hypothetical protein ABHV46_10700 [Asaia sp. BMEF1]|uniref:hypothetical protein n=1 Tax=Asaia sp. BMEF1 TaxID=3155932 RepID=UPI003F66325A